ncbi:glycosyltransferase family A protein [Alloalcanivorax gelatiniphagus]
MTRADCSVVIPAYNAARVIGDQLQALRDQRGAPPFEVVIADNGSTDDLRGAVARCRDDGFSPEIVDASRNRGVSVARNVGIGAATTDRVLVCDADDVVSPGWVRAMAEGLDAGPLVSGPVETSRLSGGSAGWVPIETRTSDLFEVWGLRYGIGCNLGLRREVWEAVGGFDETFPAGAEEIDFAWRAADLGHHFTYVPDGLIHYRIRTDLRGVLRQQYDSGRGTSTLYAKHRPSTVVPKSALRRIRHELLLLRRFPWRGSGDERRLYLTKLAFEAGKLREARRLRSPAP